jgi:hypothetical protein
MAFLVPDLPGRATSSNRCRGIQPGGAPPRVRARLDLIHSKLYTYRGASFFSPSAIHACLSHGRLGSQQQDCLNGLRNPCLVERLPHRGGWINLGEECIFEVVREVLVSYTEIDLSTARFTPGQYAPLRNIHSISRLRYISEAFARDMSTP